MPEKPPSRSYPPIIEKAVPFLLTALAILMITLLVAAVLVATGVLH